MPLALWVFLPTAVGRALVCQASWNDPLVIAEAQILLGEDGRSIKRRRESTVICEIGSKVTVVTKAAIENILAGEFVTCFTLYI